MLGTTLSPPYHYEILALQLLYCSDDGANIPSRLQLCPPERLQRRLLQRGREATPVLPCRNPVLPSRICWSGYRAAGMHIRLGSRGPEPTAVDAAQINSFQIPAHSNLGWDLQQTAGVMSSSKITQVIALDLCNRFTNILILLYTNHYFTFLICITLTIHSSWFSFSPPFASHLLSGKYF